MAPRINDIVDRVQQNLPDADVALLQKAYVYSAKVHQGQQRLSGEPYLIHPLAVAEILADMRLDEETLNRLGSRWAATRRVEVGA